MYTLDAMQVALDESVCQMHKHEISKSACRVFIKKGMRKTLKRSTMIRLMFKLKHCMQK